MNVIAGYRQLTRDARDTLFLLVVIAWTVAPHVGRLPPWCVAMVVLALGWRAWVALSARALPGRLWLLLWLAVALTLAWWTHHTLVGKDVGLTLIVVLTALKTLELRARRDAFVIFFLGFFLILTQFLFSQSLFTAFYMTLAMWGWLTALTLAHMPVGKPSLRVAARRAAGTTALGIPMMLLLFTLFPRLPPLWATADDGPHTGLSNSMQVGDIATLANDDSIAMRFRVLASSPVAARVPLPSRELYFRGPVLSRFDGTQWRPSPRENMMLDHMSEHAKDGIDVGGQAIDYEVTLEPSRLKAIPLLEATLELSARREPLPSLAFVDLQWRSLQPLSDRLRFSARAWVHFRFGPTEWSDELLDDLQLPEGSNPRSRAWALSLRHSLAGHHPQPRELAQALMRRINDQPFSYTLSPGRYGLNSIDEFWLERRSGFCEHYATAFVFLMRAMGVPARVVTGFQGAEYNPHDGYYVVRNSHAHAWAEYWQPGTGWVRADPTAAIDPQRIEAGRTLSAPAGFLQNALGWTASPWVLQGRAWAEALDNAWNQWVLNYSSQSQSRLMERLGVPNANWMDAARYLVFALTTLAGLVSLGLWLEGRHTDPWMKAYQRVQRRLQRAGWPVPEHLPPLGLGRLIQQRTSALDNAAARQLIRELEDFDRLRYGRPVTPEPQAWTLMMLRLRLHQHRRHLVTLANALANALKY